MTTTSIIDYSDKSFAVVGETKAIKDKLKELGGRFNFRLSCGAGWIFPKSKQSNVEAFINGGEVVIAKAVAAPKVKTNDLEYLEDYLKGIALYWGEDASMMAYFKKKVSGVYKLSDGSFFAFSKPRIEKSFCYSEGSTRTMKEALSLCKRAERDQEHFRCANLMGITELINEIERDDNPLGMYLYSVAYGGGQEVNQTKFTHLNYTNFVENRFCFHNLRKASDEDKKTILAALKNERVKFEKRLNTYLKRYGLSKISTWTYWADR